MRCGIRRNWRVSERTTKLIIVGIDSRRVLDQIRIEEVNQGEHMAVKHKWILKRVDITKKKIPLKMMT